MRERFTASIKDRAKGLVGTALWRGSGLVIRRDIVSESRSLERTRSHLKQGRPLIVVINHTHSLDTVVIGHAVEDYISPLDRVAGVTALKHSDPDRHKFDKTVKRHEYMLIELGQKSRKFRILRFVQRSEEERRYYKDHPQALGGKSIMRFNFDSGNEAIEILREGGIVMIAPEGTRSKDGNMQEAQTGTEGLLERVKDNGLVLPASVLPIDGKFRVVFGEPFSYEDLMREQAQHPQIKLKDLIMRKVARLVPRGRRGFYENLA
ncbi:MAG: 1-acyl-sn-glycerol-3-phosphate acyltransferase [Candidatus Levybacteria bacterium]|nr:1-acyl-sn-glycerol-3-phosphate acyltransferase [Candidatus Levybacteria bacterium]